MKNNKENEYMFYIEDDEPENVGQEFEDISSNSKADVEDIYSDSTLFSSFSTNNKKYEKKKTSALARFWKKRKTWQKTLIVTALSLILVLSIGIGVLSVVFDYNYNNITDNPEDLGYTDVIDKKIVNVALFGIDTRNTNSFKGNTDSIMILSLNTDTKKVKIISLMRDTLVPITYNGKTTYAKINSAYAKGGPELAIKVINTCFGLDISEYATVNFFGMVDIIDAVGGIDAELTKGEVAKSDGTLHAINGCIDDICKQLKVSPNKHHIYTPGKHHLNGIQAVAYSRIRYVSNIWGTSNDYGRTDRQRYVMEQLFNKAITLDKSQYVKLAKSLIPCSETSLSYSEIIDLAFSILLHSPSFSQARMPQQEYLMSAPSGFGSIVYFDLDFAKDVIHAFIYDDVTPEAYVAANGVKKNDWYRKKFPNAGTASSGSDKPSTEEPKEENPETEKPETNKPETNNPETNKPETNKPETNKPEDEKPETEKPEDGTGEGTQNPGNEENPENPDEPQEKPEEEKPSVTPPENENPGEEQTPPETT